MIKEVNGLFILESKNTSYIFKKLKSGHLEHLYYGKKIELSKDLEDAISNKCSNLNGCSIAYDGDENFGLNDICLEISTEGKGDFREPFVQMTLSNGTFTTDFIYDSYKIYDKKIMLEKMPSAYGENVSTLVVRCKDQNYDVDLEILYSVFYDVDVITRSARVINNSQEIVTINRLMSAQLDLVGNNYKFTRFGGDWINEMNKYENILAHGNIINSSNTGNSSNYANPFVMISEESAKEVSGDVYGINLIYSGNHYESFSVSGHNKSRLVAGINPNNFSYSLNHNEVFESCEAVFTFSCNGFEQMSTNMHNFVKENIVRGLWKNKERPVLLNSWEAAYFDFNEAKLLKLAKAGADLGIELFVLDDGWFGKRNNDKSSLGDWYDNYKKLSNGLAGLCKKINKLGLDFGIWVEPEMISEDSDLYRSHPDWAVKIDKQAHSLGRNQMILDLTQSVVVENIIEQMRSVFNSCNITYVKWDMNRNFSDVYSSKLSNQMEFSFRYTLGLYKILDTLTKEFPHILFEGCASGGNRFDLGILSYMPQIWASDNTDAISRISIQNGYSYGYPQSTYCNHVSGVPNHQTLRSTPLDTRFNVASFGILGYECNFNDMSSSDRKIIAEQIITYKKWRHVFQFGNFTRLEENINKTNNNKDSNSQLVKWLVVNNEKDKAIGIMVQAMAKPNLEFICFKCRNLDDRKKYHFYNEDKKYEIERFGDLINTESPVHIKTDSTIHKLVSHFIKLDGEKEDYIVSGSLLNYCGIKLAQGYAGVGYNDNTRMYQDYDSRMYFIEEEKESK
ncbi:MAG: alpha-galactosidase [Anaerorhabdus sp.]